MARNVIGAKITGKPTAVKLRLKKGDQVRVVSGKHRGSEGEILRVDHENNRVLIKNVAIIKKAQRPTQENPRGGFKEQESPIHASNVRLLDPKLGVPTRIRAEVQEGGRKVRVAVKSGTVLDE
jgi:large subunit ribosomal protein L24